MFSVFVALVVALAFLSALIDIYAAAMRHEDVKAGISKPRVQIPADDLIGKELRDVQ